MLGLKTARYDVPVLYVYIISLFRPVFALQIDFFSCMIQVNLNKQLIVIVERILSTVRVDPAKLVTVLRIAEREERYAKSRRFLI